ncbi:DNA helicase/exodeoxyribonuclease V, subunit A [Shimia gijangensis]|uniref:DNA 3'-5' helicase n=1 Tax=Shimia gijangensis TaxID=1470563 RepID=A0A1M6MTB7_9RHOB|nr:double-strand break repair helicase AddA [Shimia gijangensis]SHJ86758.1 DNA helicase/exodeoxyribonuclease V, subunit A [Shimia gijangensis]
MIHRDDATERQVQAARPTESTWLSANAGSGKTRVLTDRVARLLLEKVLPQHILCLTYTKAAASEMQNRLFERLGAWAMKDDDALRDELRSLGVDELLDADLLRSARTLFARAIETPGGLKIQTIHSFCSSLLRRFPLEAGVSPLFVEMEDRAAALLREDIISEMAEGDDGALVQRLAGHYSGETFDTLTSEIVRNRDFFEQPLGVSDFLSKLGQDLSLNEADVQGHVFLGDEAETLDQLIKALRTGGVTDNRNADKLAVISEIGFSALPALEDVFLTGSGAKIPFSAKLGSFPTKAVQKSHPDLMVRIDPLMQRVETARELRLALIAAHRSAVLSEFGFRFLDVYDARKQQHGWLDFDDLILKARALLNDPFVAEWVLYRLDGGIDHILVDEAQDTSPVQWQVIERLTQEFTSGSGARSDVERTIFVVGDKKQSIYSFQGADPAEFDRMQLEFGRRLEPTGKPLNPMVLEYSFRSSDAILRLVDQCFDGQDQAGFPQEMKHRAFHQGLPGRVDLWPVVEQTPQSDNDEWYKPVDRLGETHHTIILANRVAAEIEHLIETQETIPAKKQENGQFSQRPVQAGDFLVLVQRRSELFHEIIRACKARGLPIAGADRLKVGAELAVKDLGALLSFLSTPEDSLSLATTLRSPLFGWSEQDLFDLAHRRESPLLWQALRARKDDFPQTMAIILDLMAQADFLRPYDLIERTLTRHNGRRNLLARLGSEAEDGINALLSQALAFERSAVPSLTGFLIWMETDDLEIKRQMDSAGNRIRVMTVHGSKGLEAPIVILPDTGKRLIRNDGQLVANKDHVLWTMPANASPNAMAKAREAKAETVRAERQRLLYVAMTRAEKWLIVAAAGDLGKDGQTWYQTIERGLNGVGAEAHDFVGGQGLRYSHGDWSGPIEEVQTRTQIVLPDVPEFAKLPPKDPPASKPTLSPSDLGGAKALAGDAGLDEEAAKRRGRWVHLLLEHLPDHPQGGWPGIASNLLLSTEEPPSDTELDTLLDEATRVLTNPDLRAFFGDETLAEVPVTANLGAARLHGIVDRLIVRDDHILIVDFKTNATVPQRPDQTPAGLLRQMGAYAHALQQIYKDREIRTAILWTRTGTLMQMPHDLVTKALQSTGYLDDLSGAS